MQSRCSGHISNYRELRHLAKVEAEATTPAKVAELEELEYLALNGNSIEGVA
jgi:hypothetical protein